MSEPVADPDPAELASLLQADCAALSATASVPPAGLVWWRATIRARADAARIAERPIALAQTIAVACIMALGFGTAAAAWRVAPDVILQHAVLLVFAVAIGLLVAPIAVFVALAD